MTKYARLSPHVPLERYRSNSNACDATVGYRKPGRESANELKGLGFRLSWFAAVELGMFKFAERGEIGAVGSQHVELSVNALAEFAP